MDKLHIFNFKNLLKVLNLKLYLLNLYLFKVFYNCSIEDFLSYLKKFIKYFLTHYLLLEDGELLLVGPLRVTN